jgi:hypothetical protein
MALSLIQKGLKSLNDYSTEDYKNSIIEFQNRVKTLRLGYVPGVIRHYFHGSKKNRRYNDRWQILLKHNYQPTIHITHDEDGILIPTQTCPKEMLEQILEYFAERNEDEFYQEPNLYKQDEEVPEIKNNIDSFLFFENNSKNDEKDNYFDMNSNELPDNDYQLPNITCVFDEFVNPGLI